MLISTGTHPYPSPHFLRIEPYGGVLERQIQSARTMQISLLHTHGRSLNDESLRTILAETEVIVNSRPLTVDMLGDVQSEQPICPSNVLTTESKVVLPPPVFFVTADEYSRKDGDKYNI